MPALSPSELVLNDDGSIYHLHLRPEQLADIVITVGDPGRVAAVSRYFDEIQHQVSKREFVTHTGRLGKKRITVVSTGIGPDNIDIVVNELDALANIDFDTRRARPETRCLTFIRLGTSGSLQSEVGIDSLLFSAFGLGLDNLLSFYHYEREFPEEKLLNDFNDFLAESGCNLPVKPYAALASHALLEQLGGRDPWGITLTAPGFYAPQGRVLRARSRLTEDMLGCLPNFRSQGYSVTNFEMETAALYGLSRILGHRALSCSVILADRDGQQFSADPTKAVDGMIRTMLERVSGWEEQ